MDKPVFPLLALESESIAFFGSLDDLCRVSRTAVGNGYLDRVLLLDAGGAAFRVSRYQQRSGGWRTLFGGVLYFDVELGPVAPLALEELRFELLSQIQRDADFWDAGGELERLKSDVESATGLQQLAAIIVGYLHASSAVAR